MPDDFQDDLPEDLTKILNVFLELNHYRDYDSNVGFIKPIPLSTFRDYFHMFLPEMADDIKIELQKLLISIDSDYVESVNKETSRKQKRTSKPVKKPIRKARKRR